MFEAKQKRKFWQFHLSTAVLLLLTVGGLLYANIACFKTVYDLDRGLLYGVTADGKRIKIGMYHNWGAEYREYGWPIVSYGTVASRSYWIASSLIIDGASAIVILVAIFVFSEWLIRGREARKA